MLTPGPTLQFKNKQAHPLRKYKSNSTKKNADVLKHFGYICGLLTRLIFIKTAFFIFI